VPPSLSRSSVVMRGKCGVARRPGGLGGEGVLRYCPLFLLLEMVLGAMLEFIFFTPWLCGGGRSWSRCLYASWFAHPGSSSPTAGSVAPIRINGCRASTLAASAGSPPSSPPQVACSPAVVRWPVLGGGVGCSEVAQGLDRVLCLVARSFLHFCRVFTVIFIFLRDLPTIV
jgi:hypothetical protein